MAAVCFTLTTLLFLDFTGTLHAWFGWLARIQFLPALLALNLGVVAALVVLTLVFGRIYCSVICPLGVMQDIFSAARGAKKRNRFSYSPEKKWLRYGMLALMLVSVAAGINAVVALLAPYSAYGRIAGNLLQPVYMAGNNVLAAISERLDSYAFYSVDVWIKSLPTFIVASVTLVVIAILAVRGGRTYCNTVCPVGTVLGVLSRFSLFKVRFDTDKCRDCGLCARNCKASAIDVNNHKIDYSRCVACGDCLEKCSFGSLSYGLKSKGNADDGAGKCETNAGKHKSGDEKPADTGRRAFLLGAALAATATALSQSKKKVDGGLAVIEDKKPVERHTPITPPGSLSARNMASHCTACQLCVSACPNEVLRPSTDASTFMQPVMSFERGYCRPECTRCSHVCPTGAVKPISKADKSATHIGHAVWIKKNCVPVTDGVECGNCARHCPAGAITMIPLDPDNDESPRVPAINESRCIGCGACENLCPARPFSAIYVEGHEVHRIG